MSDANTDANFTNPNSSLCNYFIFCIITRDVIRCTLTIVLCLSTNLVMDGLFGPVCLFACGVGVVLIKHNKSTINDLYSFLTHHPQVSRKSRTFNENEDPKQLMTVAKSELCGDRLEFHMIKYKFPAVFIAVAGEDNKSGTKYVSEFIFGAEITTEESYDIFENSAILSNVAFMLMPSNPAAESKTISRFFIKLFFTTQLNLHDLKYLFFVDILKLLFNWVVKKSFIKIF